MARSSQRGRRPAAKPPVQRNTSVQLQAIIDSVMDGVVTIDRRGTVESFNPAAERMFGYAADEVIGENVKMLMPSPYHEEHDTYLSNFQETGVAKIIGTGREVTGRRKDGEIFPLDLAVTEMPGGKFVGILRDITQRKQSENQIRQQNQALLELSAPIIQVWEGIVLLPLIGVIDTARAQLIIESLLEAIVKNEARVAIIDITGVPIMDTVVAQHLLKTVNATGMLGAKTIVTGISPEVSQTLVKLNVDFSAIHTCGNLRAALAEALAAVGRRVVGLREDDK